MRILFVRPPAGAWAFDATDGSDLDADGRTDGQVTVHLSKLQPLHGSRPAADGIATGDVILVVDPRRIRSGEVVVP